MFSFLKSIISIPTKEERAALERAHDRIRIEICDNIQQVTQSLQETYRQLTNNNAITISAMLSGLALGEYLAQSASSLLASEKRSNASEERMSQIGRMVERYRAATNSLAESYNQLFLLADSGVTKVHKYYNALSELQSISSAFSCEHSNGATYFKNLKLLEKMSAEVAAFSNRVVAFEEKTKDMTPGQVRAERTNSGYQIYNDARTMGTRAANLAGDVLDTAAALAYGAGPRN